MPKDLCAVVHTEGVKAALPYLIGAAALLVTGSAVALFIPVITLVRNVCFSLGSIKVNSWYSYDVSDDDAPLDCDAKKQHEVSQVVSAKDPEDTKGEEGPNVDAPIPIRAKKLSQNTPAYGAALHAASEKVTLRTRRNLVDTINILVNANNTYYIIMIFLMLTIIFHFGLVLMDTGMRIVEYNHMLRAFEKAKDAINASAATVEPLTIVVNKFKEVAEP